MRRFCDCFRREGDNVACGWSSGRVTAECFGADQVDPGSWTNSSDQFRGRDQFRRQQAADRVAEVNRRRCGTIVVRRALEDCRRR